MKKEEFIKQRGEAAFEKWQQQTRDWAKVHRKEANVISNRWRAANPDKVKADRQEVCHKGGKYYEKNLEYQRTGIPGERKRIRMKHGYMYRPYKQIVAPESQIHHEWIPDTADFRGVALVETNPHRYGIIDVIKVLEGGITLFAEKEILKGVFKQK